MAFPTVPTSAAGRILAASQANTTAARTFPNLSSLTKNSGDLLIAIAVAYQTSTGTDAAFSSWGGGFTEFSDRATSTTMAIGMAYKFSTGSETGTFTVTQAGTITGHAVMFLMSIPGAHATTPPEASTKANGTTSAPSSENFNPAGWDVEDTLWIAVCGVGETSTSGSFTGVSGAPGGTTPTWTDLFGPGTLTADVVGGVEAAVAFGLRTQASVLHTGFNVDTSNARNSQMIVAVRPAPQADPPNEGSVSGAIDWAGTVTGTTVKSGGVSGAVGWVGSVIGTTLRNGAVDGSIGWVGSVTGEAPVVVQDGEVLGSITWVGTVTGATVHRGDVSGTVGWAGTVNGTTQHAGEASGAVSWAGVVSGATDHVGNVTGAVSWAGTVNGESPGVGVQEGSVEGTITWTGSVTGSTLHEGAVAGNVAWSGVVDGTTTRTGTSSGSVDWSGTVTGNQPSQFFYSVTLGVAVDSDLSGGTSIITVEHG